MKFKKFFKEWKRMCDTYESCGDCPIGMDSCCLLTSTPEWEAYELERLVKQWSKNNPVVNGDDSKSDTTTYLYGKIPYPMCRKTPCFSHGDIRHNYFVTATG